MKNNIVIDGFKWTTTDTTTTNPYPYRDNSSTIDLLNKYEKAKKIQEEVFNAITEKDLKLIKEQIKSYMTDQMKKDAQKIAGKLFVDIENLKKEKTQFKKDITLLKNKLKKTKEEIRIEIKAMEEMIERKTKKMLRFGNMDFSK